MGDESIRDAVSDMVPADNLAEPRKATFPILLKPKTGGTEAVIRELLKHELDAEI